MSYHCSFPFLFLSEILRVWWHALTFETGSFHRSKLGYPPYRTSGVSGFACQPILPGRADQAPQQGDRGKAQLWDADPVLAGPLEAMLTLRGEKWLGYPWGRRPIHGCLASPGPDQLRSTGVGKDTKDPGWNCLGADADAGNSDIIHAGDSGDEYEWFNAIYTVIACDNMWSQYYGPYHYVVVMQWLYLPNRTIPRVESRPPNSFCKYRFAHWKVYPYFHIVWLILKGPPRASATYTVSLRALHILIGFVAVCGDVRAHFSRQFLQYSCDMTCKCFHLEMPFEMKWPFLKTDGGVVNVKCPEL